MKYSKAIIKIINMNIKISNYFFILTKNIYFLSFILKVFEIKIP